MTKEICGTCHEPSPRCTCLALRLETLPVPARRRFPDNVKRFASTDLPVFRPLVCDHARHATVKSDPLLLEIETTYVGIQEDVTGGELELRNCVACSSTLAVWRRGRN